MKKFYSVLMWLWIMLPTSYAQTLTVPLYLTVEKGQGKALGSIQMTDTPQGLLLTPKVANLEPGDYGIHIHENPNCDNKGMAAGGHWDPIKSGTHTGPYASRGHKGDLPVLVIDKTSHQALPLLAPLLTTGDLHGKSIIVHEGGDNYADFPLKMGGGGARMACGIIH